MPSVIRIVVAGVVVSSCALVIGLGVGCGGKVFVDEGLGGAGGQATSTTGGNTGASSAGGSKSTGGSSTGSSSTGSSSTGSSSTGSSSSTGTSSSGAGGSTVACGSDDTSTPQCDNCIDQALTGVCTLATDDCFNDDGCTQFNDCSFSCFGEMACCLDCASMEPEGAKLFGELVDCVVCQECNAECAGFFPGFSTCL